MTKTRFDAFQFRPSKRVFLIMATCGLHRHARTHTFLVLLNIRYAIVSAAFEHLGMLQGRTGQIYRLAQELQTSALRVAPVKSLKRLNTTRGPLESGRKANQSRPKLLFTSQIARSCKDGCSKDPSSIPDTIVRVLKDVIALRKKSAHFFWWRRESKKKF